MADLPYLAQTFVTGAEMRELALARHNRIDMFCVGPRRSAQSRVLFDFELFDTSLQREYLRDAHTGQLATAMSADFCGNTDSWSRAASYLLRNRLLAPDYGAPQ
jgi:hypothetical protein